MDIARTEVGRTDHFPNLDIARTEVGQTMHVVTWQVEDKKMIFPAWLQLMKMFIHKMLLIIFCTCAPTRLRTG
jgi:hypothetical protein